MLHINGENNISNKETRKNKSRKHSQMETIKKVIEEYNLKRMTRYLCNCLGVYTPQESFFVR